MPARAALREARRVGEPSQPLCSVWLRWRQTLHFGQAHCQRQKGCARQNESQQAESDQPHRGRVGLDIASDPADGGQVRAKDRCGAYALNARVPIVRAGIPPIPRLVPRCALT